jgi:hypothetical protein
MSVETREILLNIAGSLKNLNPPQHTGQFNFKYDANGKIIKFPAHFDAQKAQEEEDLLYNKLWPHSADINKAYDEYYSKYKSSIHKDNWQKHVGTFYVSSHPPESDKLKMKLKCLEKWLKAEIEEERVAEEARIERELSEVEAIVEEEFSEDALALNQKNVKSDVVDLEADDKDEVVTIERFHYHLDAEL